MNILFGILAVIAAVIALALIAGVVAKARLRRAYPPVGDLIDIGGTRLHAQVVGGGNMTVVFDAGVGGTSLHWTLVQPEIASQVCTVSYDRAGLGWSAGSSQPQTFEAMADQLYSLLRTLCTPGPYVLVGHSFGGVVVRQFAHKHPELVAGMVLVDSAHEEQFTKRFPEPVRQMASKMVRSMGPMAWVAASGIPALLAQRLPTTPGLPAAIAEQERAVRLAGAKHTNAMLAEFAAIVHHPPTSVDTLGDIPLIVLSHGIPQPVPNMPPEVNEAYEQVWQAL